MQLNLVHNRNSLGLTEQTLQVFRQEITHTDRANQPFLSALFHFMPCIEVRILPGARPVNEVKVNVVKSQAFQGLLKCLACFRLVIVPQLR